MVNLISGLTTLPYRIILYEKFSVFFFYPITVRSRKNPLPVRLTVTDPCHGQDVRDTKNPCNDAALGARNCIFVGDIGILPDSSPKTLFILGERGLQREHGFKV